MKQAILILLLTTLLCGCGARETAETVDDTLETDVPVIRREIQVELPGEAAIPTMETEGSRYYICDGYEISLETFPSGDVQKAIETISGFDPSRLTVVKTRQQEADRYDFVWTAEGEQGGRLGRASILDDGNFLYTLSVLRDQENKENSQVVWRTVFESFELG